MAPKQIFHDASGKRRVITNVLTVSLFLLAISIVIFVFYFLVKLNHLNQIGEHQQNAIVQKDSQSVILYTDNHPKAYSILNDQITNLDTLIAPYYRVESDGTKSPQSYKNLKGDIDFISKNKLIHYDWYFLLSSKNYELLPLDRASNSDIDASLPGLVDDKQVETIIKDLKGSEAQGLFVEISPEAIEAPVKLESMIVWLDKLNSSLSQENLKLGVSLKESTEISAYQKISSLSDLIYLSADYNVARPKGSSQLDKLIKNSKAAVILELHTVSNEKNNLNEFDYIKNADYSSAEDLAVGKLFERAQNTSFQLQLENSTFEIYDSVSNYNFIHDVVNTVKAGDGKPNISFAISSPGYEEYTTWGLIKNPFDFTENIKLLSNSSTASLDILQKGDGEVYQIENTGKLGTRQLATDDTGLITSSKIMSPYIPPSIVKSGTAPKKIALTFDDGPHPIYTRKVLDILDQYGVKGTFFLIGQNVLENPEIAREIVTRGHEVENHSYSHPIFSKLDPASEKDQIKSTSKIIFDITGHNAQFFRRPYSDDSKINTTSDIRYLEFLDGLGLRASEYDIDSKDWELGSAEESFEKIKKDIEASNGNYSQILLHDSHQNPKVTLDLLPLLVEYLRSKDIEIVRVDQLTSIRNTKIASTNTYKAVRLQKGVVDLIRDINIAIILISALKYIWLIHGSIIYTLRNSKDRRIIKTKSKKLPKLSIIIPCYNEEKVIGNTIRAIQNNSYKNFQLIIANDGSTDKTSNIVKKFAKKDKRITLLDLPNGGKAEAQQAGIRKARTNWIVFCDADTILDKEALSLYAKATLGSENIAAVAGNIKVGNTINALTRSQAVEYAMSHLFSKSAQDIINSITVVPGASGLWNRAALKKAGGFSSDTLVEDTDTTIKLISGGSKVCYKANIHARTEAPQKVAMLYRQRLRWQFGNTQALFKHRRGLFNPKYRLMGFVGLPLLGLELLTTIFFPLLLIFSGTGLLAKVFDWKILTSSELTLIDPGMVIKLTIGLVIVEVVLNLIAIVNEKLGLRQTTQLILNLPFYFVVYKTLLSYITIKAIFQAFKGLPPGWGYQKRNASVKYA